MAEVVTTILEASSASVLGKEAPKLVHPLDLAIRCLKMEAELASETSCFIKN
jgi:hypothetical protein